MTDPDQSPLGKPSAYADQYDASLLFAMPRAPKRAELGITGTPPFFGADMWTAFELSWLNLRGKPQLALAHITVPCESPHIIESKSFKLYLNSFNNTRFLDAREVRERIRADVGANALTHVSRIGKACVVEAVQIKLERFAFNDVGRLARHRDVRQRQLRFAAQIKPAQLERRPQVGAKKRRCAGDAQLCTLGRARHREQQGGVVLVGVSRGFAEWGLVSLCHGQAGTCWVWGADVEALTASKCEISSGSR